MRELEVTSLYTLEETLAAPLLSAVTYPWEALPKIGAFILELGASLSEEEYEKREKTCGLPERPEWRPRPPLPVRPSLGKTRKCGTVPLFGEMPW